MRKIYFLFAVVLLLTSLSYSQQRKLTLGNTETEQRVALVIGNSGYETDPLKNPVNDARDMAQTLSKLGFEVIHRENLDQNSMKRAIRTFGEKIRQGGVGLFYYAGHGVQVKGENYLVPIGAKVESEEEVEYECVSAGFVLAQMESAGNSTNIVILDACRNNPFARSFRSGSRGLAVMDAPSGTLIAYATAPGSVAIDGSGRNGIYTQELLRFMRTPNLGIEEVFKRVRISVRNLTRRKQTPWEASSLEVDFYFLRGDQPTDTAQTQPVVPPTDPGAVTTANPADNPSSGNTTERNAVSLTLKVGELLEGEKFDEALQAATEAIQLDPKYAKAYHKRGICYLRKGDYDLAISDHTEAIRLDPQYAEAYLSRGINYGHKNENDQAIRDFTEAIKINPQYAYAYYIRGEYYRWERNYDQAIRDFTEAVRLDPYQAKAHYSRGIAYYLNKNYDQAVKAYTEAIRLKPQFAEAYFERAYAHEKLGYKERAKADRRQSKETDNYFKETYSFFAWRTSSVHSTDGTLYISPEGVEFAGKGTTTNILSFSCSEIISLKIKRTFLFSNIYGTYGVEIKTRHRKDAYLFRTYDDEQVVKLIQRTCKVGF